MSVAFVYHSNVCRILDTVNMLDLSQILYDVICIRSRVACRHNETDADISNVASAPAVVMETNDVTSDLIADNSTSQNGNRRRDNATRPKYRLIRGSKQAATITRKELLKTDWCQTEPFQQIIHEVSIY